MDEMDALPVDPGSELRKGVGPGLEARPVVVVLPVPAQLDQEIAFGAVLPPGAGYLVGPPGPGQPVTEIVDLGGGDAHIEGFDGRWGHGLVHSRVTPVGVDGHAVGLLQVRLTGHRQPSPKIKKLYD